jgi:lysophospholipase L1-like esterase
MTDPAAVTVLCFGDSNTHGAPGDDPAYTRLAAGVRWTGRLQQLLGPGYYVIEEGLSGRTIDLDYPDRPGLNGRSYLIPCLLSHSPLDVIVLMLGTNDVKLEFQRPVERIAESWQGFLDDLFATAVTAGGARPRVILVSPIHIDDSQPRFIEEMASFDSESVRKANSLSSWYQSIATERGLRFLDAATCARAGADGIHLTVDSHASLAELIAGAVRSAR